MYFSRNDMAGRAKRSTHHDQRMVIRQRVILMNSKHIISIPVTSTMKHKDDNIDDLQKDMANSIDLEDATILKLAGNSPYSAQTTNLENQIQ